MLIATPNTTVDRTVRVPQLRPGAVLRPGRAVSTAGGKGVNVARIGAAFGRRSTLIGFRPDDDAPLLDRLIEREPIVFCGVPCPGEARFSTIYLEDSGRATVLNEPGPDISEEAWQRYELAVLDELNTGRHQTLVCTGSLPPGVPADAYGRLTVIGHRANVRVVVDTSRAALAASLSFGPDLVTPNLSEAEHAVHGRPEATVDEADPGVRHRAAAAVRELCARGAKSAAVTVGAAGTAFGTGENVSWIPTVEVEVANPIGAGDSFVGGLVEAWESGGSDLDSVLFGVATATASVEKPVAGEVDVARARELAAHLTATPIELYG